jgi:hypothetical protein
VKAATSLKFRNTTPYYYTPGWPDAPGWAGLEGFTWTTTYPDGSYTTGKPDGTVISFTSSDGTTITEKPDGTTITENKDGTWKMIFPKKPDGSVSTYYNNGNPQK